VEKELASIEVCFQGTARDSLERAIKTHIKTRRGITFVDIVKFLYQSVLGSHHVLDQMNDEQIETWIKEALESAKPADRPLTERLYGKRWVRLDLGAFKREHGGDYRPAARMFMKGKLAKRATSKEFLTVMERLKNMVADRKITPLNSSLHLTDPVNRFLKTYRQKGYPPTHHSPLYTKKNPPYILVPSNSVPKTE
jgi:hypothetical protein